MPKTKKKTAQPKVVETDASARPPNLTLASGTLTFNLQIPKVERFMHLSRR